MLPVDITDRNMFITDYRFSQHTKSPLHFLTIKAASAASFRPVPKSVWQELRAINYRYLFAVIIEVTFTIFKQNKRKFAIAVTSS